MKSILELNETKVPAVRIDSTLNKYDKVILLPEKLEKANAMLKNTNFANIIGKKHSS